MAVVIPNDWAATTTYAVDDLALRNGIVYRATAAITGNANNTEPRLTPGMWTVSYIIRAEDWYGCIEAARQELNVDDEEINNSIPYYMQLAEQSFYTRVRPPTTLVTTQIALQNITVPGYSGRVYIPVPSDLLQVENMRVAGEQGFAYGLLAAGRIEIKAAQSDSDFETVRQLYQDNDSVYGSRYLTNFQSPVYRFVNIGGVPYFELAPSAYPVGSTTIELRYYQSEPQLGTVRPRINANGEAINSEGQTQMQWNARTDTGLTASSTNITFPTTPVAVSGDTINIRTTIVTNNGEPRNFDTLFNISPGINGNDIAAGILGELTGQLSGEPVMVSRPGGNQVRVTHTDTGADSSVTIMVSDFRLGGNPATATVVNTAGTNAPFVQDMVRIERNWYTSNAPHMLIYGALTNASAYLKDDTRTAIWEARFKQAEAETIDLIYRFEEVRPTEQQMYNPYSI